MGPVRSTSPLSINARVLRTGGIHRSSKSLKECSNKFTGDLLQRTPMFSARKINGVRLYKLARKGIVKEFTGISDPYEKPSKADIIVDSSTENPIDLVAFIYKEIKNMGYLK